VFAHVVLVKTFVVLVEPDDEDQKFYIVFVRNKVNWAVVCEVRTIRRNPESRRRRRVLNLDLDLIPESECTRKE
jgi:hypothetical protein